jgi:hypothetical protein
MKYAQIVMGPAGSGKVPTSRDGLLPRQSFFPYCTFTVCRHKTHCYIASHCAVYLLRNNKNPLRHNWPASSCGQFRLVFTFHFKYIFTMQVLLGPLIDWDTN